jgi:hypothetical protein
MKKTVFAGWLRRCAAAAVVFSALGSGQAQMKFAVSNESGQSDSTVWVLFFTGTTPVTGTYFSKSQNKTVNLAATSVGTTNAVQLSDVGADSATGLPTFDLTAFNGQMWFSYGSASVSFDSGAPSPTSTSSSDIGNFNKRWQYIEPTIIAGTPSGGVTPYGVDVDQTIIDFFSIPLTIQAMNPNGTVATGVPANNQFSSATNAIVRALAGSTLSPGSFSNIYDTGTPTNGAPVNPTSLPDANFARAVSPTQAPSLYHDWTAYIQALAPNGSLNPSGTLSIHIADQFVGSGAGSGNGFQAQYYDLQVTFSTSDPAMTMTGNTYTDSSETTPVIQGLNIQSTLADLNATTGIYGNAAAFTWSSTTPMTTYANGTASTSGNETASANDVLGRIVGDILAGLSMGYPGSTFGAANASGVWWQHPEKAFTAAQSNANYYNTWAAALQPLTSSYGLGYEDRFGQNLLAFANGSVTGFSASQTVSGGYLKVTLGSDTPTPSSNPTLVIRAPKRVTFRGNRRVLPVRLSVAGAKLKAHATGGAKVLVRGHNPFRVILTNVKRKVTIVRLIATDNLGQRTIRKIRFLHR